MAGSSSPTWNTATTFEQAKKTHKPTAGGRGGSRSMTDGYTRMTRNRVGIGLAAAVLVLGAPALALAQEAAAAAPAPTVNGADTAWMLVAAALVLLMTPALAFF